MPLPPFSFVEGLVEHLVMNGQYIVLSLNARAWRCELRLFVIRYLETETGANQAPRKSVEQNTKHILAHHILGNTIKNTISHIPQSNGCEPKGVQLPGCSAGVDALQKQWKQQQQQQQLYGDTFACFINARMHPEYYVDFLSPSQHAA